MKMNRVGPALAAGVLGLAVVTGCASAPDEEASSSADALGRDPAACVFSHRAHRWESQCTFLSKPEENAVVEAAVQAGGVGSCAELTVSVVGLAAGTMTVVLAPASVADAAFAVGAAASCGLYLGEMLSRIVPTSCTTWELALSDRERDDDCAMTCGGSERVSNGNCYCGVGDPLACEDAPPTATATPPAPPPAPAVCHDGGPGC